MTANPKPDQDYYGIDKIMAAATPIKPNPPKRDRETRVSEDAEIKGNFYDEDNLGNKPTRSLCISASLPLCPVEAIKRSMPANRGQVQRCIFRFARILRGLPEYANATPDRLKEAINEWHAKVGAQGNWEWKKGWTEIDTQGEFKGAWDKVRYADGDGPMEEMLREADEGGVPDEAKHYACTDLRRLAGLCRRLQYEAGSAPFFLSCRIGADLLGIERMALWRRLKVLEADGLLVIEEKPTEVRATRYYYKPLTNETIEP